MADALDAGNDDSILRGAGRLTMTAYLEGNWERSEASPADPGALARFRLFCVASNAVDALRVSNYNNAWRTDGSEIGRATLYDVAPNPGSYSAPIAGSLYSGSLSYAVPNPPTLASGRVYPTAVRSAEPDVLSVGRVDVRRLRGRPCC